MQLSELKKNLEFVIVDDNDIDHFLVRKLLQNGGYQKPVLCFSDPAAALLHLQNAGVEKNIPGIVFLDVNMPDMNGFEFLQAYSSFPKTVKDHYAIIMLSSSLSADDIARSNADPYVKDYLNKPFTLQKLEGVLKRLGLLTTS